MSFNKLGLVKNALQKERGVLLRTVKNTKLARDAAPSAMESHHDTDRNQNERIAVALEEKYQELDKLVQLLPNTVNVDSKTIDLWSYVELNFSDSILKLILVPEGYGGREYKGIKFISDTTPLGKIILNKKIGESFLFNKSEYKIQTLS